MGINMQKVLLLVSIILLGTSSISIAVTVNKPSSLGASNVSITNFALSGVITRYQALRSIIVIDGKAYILDGKGELNNTDLKAGARIKYNLEKSTKENTGRVTKIWLDTGDR